MGDNRHLVAQRAFVLTSMVAISWLLVVGLPAAVWITTRSLPALVAAASLLPLAGLLAGRLHGPVPAESRSHVVVARSAR